MKSHNLDKELYPKFRFNYTNCINLTVGIASILAVMKAISDEPFWVGASLMALYVSWLCWFIIGTKIR